MNKDFENNPSNDKAECLAYITNYLVKEGIIAEEMKDKTEVKNTLQAMVDIDSVVCDWELYKSNIALVHVTEQLAMHDDNIDDENDESELVKLREKINAFHTSLKAKYASYSRVLSTYSGANTATSSKRNKPQLDQTKTPEEKLLSSLKTYGSYQSRETSLTASGALFYVELTEHYLNYLSSTSEPNIANPYCDSLDYSKIAYPKNTPENEANHKLIARLLGVWHYLESKKASNGIDQRRRRKDFANLLQKLIDMPKLEHKSDFQHLCDFKNYLDKTASEGGIFAFTKTPIFGRSARYLIWRDQIVPAMSSHYWSHVKSKDSAPNNTLHLSWADAAVRVQKAIGVLANTDSNSLAAKFINS